MFNLFNKSNETKGARNEPMLLTNIDPMDFVLVVENNPRLKKLVVYL